MKKNDYTGWKNVFAFSFIQGIKQKSFAVLLIISGLLIMIGLPLSTYFQNRSASKLANSEVATLSVYDETGMGFDYAEILSGDRYQDLKLDLQPAESFEDKEKAIEETEKSKDALVKVSFVPESNSFSLTFVKSANQGFSKEDYSAMVNDFTMGFGEIKKQALEVTDEQEAFLEREVITKVNTVNIDEDGAIVPEEEENKTEGISMDEYMILLGGNVIVIFIVSFAGGAIANSVVTEKSTRVVEYLMINVRPMALIVGKILASLLQVILQFLILGACYMGARIINNALFGEVVDESKANTLVLVYQAFSKVSPIDLLIMLLIIILGVLFFCIIAGLAGASVSRLEELAEGMKIYQFFMIGGSYIGMGLTIAQMVGGINVWIIRIASLIPISSPFIVPANLLLGKIGTGTAFVSLLVLAALTFAAFSFTAKVYESMIFYNGNVLKFKDILAISKNRSMGRKEAK